MNVMDVARAIGLTATHNTNATVSGTVDEQIVLAAIAELAVADPDNGDLFDDAAQRVVRARSAGAEALNADIRPIQHRPVDQRDVATIQLRYRAEMADIFTDLAIDVGLRQHRKLAAAPA